MPWRLKAGQTKVEPATLVELKTYIRATEHTLEDNLILELGVAARKFVESFCEVVLVQNVYEEYLDEFPEDCLELSLSPVASVTEVSYKTIETPSTYTALALDTDYSVDTVSRVARIAPILEFPTTAEVLNAVKIEYVAGATPADALGAESIKHYKVAIMMIVADMFENRQNSISKMPTKVEMYLRSELDFSFV